MPIAGVLTPGEQRPAWGASLGDAGAKMGHKPAICYRLRLHSLCVAPAMQRVSLPAWPPRKGLSHNTMHLVVRKFLYECRTGGTKVSLTSVQIMTHIFTQMMELEDLPIHKVGATCNK